MTEPGDLQAPPWLQRNWTPKEPFDPTPWLQERYKRSIEAQTLPLQLQGMALKNKADALAIEHQGIQNDVANLDLDAFRSDLAKIRAYGESTGGDPIKMTETPPPYLSSVQGQKIMADQIALASKVGYVQRRQQLETAKYALASVAASHGQEVPVSKDPVTGQPTFSTADLAEAFNQGALRDIVGKAFLESQKGNTFDSRVQALEDAKNELGRAQASKDPVRIAKAEQRLQSVSQNLPGQQMTVFDPATGKPIVQMGRGGVGDGLTTATNTEEQKNVLNSEQTLGDLLRTRDQLNSNNVAGIWPTIANKVFDEVMGNISRDFVNKERVAGRSAINWTRQDVVNQMRQRYGEHAVQRISSMLPSTGLLESPENARILADEAIKHIAIDSAKRSMAIGRPPAEHVLRAIGRLSNDELDEEMSSGYLPPSIGIAASKIRNLRPGQVPTGFEPKAQSTGKPLVVSPESSVATSPGKITWEDLFKLYRSGKLRSATIPSDPDEE